MAETMHWIALSERLPHLVDAQFAAYRRLAHAEVGLEDGPRELVAWENARKAALAHLQALIRVYDLVQAHLAPTQASLNEGGSDGLQSLLIEVRQELAEQPDDIGEFGT